MKITYRWVVGTEATECGPMAVTPANARGCPIALPDLLANSSPAEYWFIAISPENCGAARITAGWIEEPPC